MKIGVLAIQGDFAEHIIMLKRLGGGDRRGAPARPSRRAGWPDHARRRIHHHRQAGGGFWLAGAAAAVWAERMPSGAPAPGRSSSQRMPAATSRCWVSWISPSSATPSAARWIPSKPTWMSPFQRYRETGEPFHAIFIRAPLIETVTGTAQVLASLPDGRIVAAQQGRLLATSFHPELTDDDRFHRYFLSIVK